MIRAVGFDLDGTLFDDRQYVRAGLLRAAAELESATGVDLSEALLAAYFQRGIREETFDVVLAEHDLPTDLVPRLVDAYHANDADLVPFPEAETALETLAADYDLGLVTGGRNGRDKLARLGLAEYFDAVLVTSERSYTKRDRAAFVELLAELEASSDEAVFVGDRPDLDFPQANRIGLTTVRVETGRYATSDAAGSARPDVTVSTLADLPEVLSNIDR